MKHKQYSIAKGREKKEQTDIFQNGNRMNVLQASDDKLIGAEAPRNHQVTRGQCAVDVAQ